LKNINGPGRKKKPPEPTIKSSKDHDEKEEIGIEVWYKTHPRK